MLTDAELRNTRGKSKQYKKTDRDGLYVLVTPSGGITFKYDYRFNGRRETVTFGTYGPAGLSLANAREKLIDAKRQIAEGVSLAMDKRRVKRRLKEAQSFEEVANRWMDHAPMADSTRHMRRSIFVREVLPQWRNRLLNEITPNDLRAHCLSIVERGARRPFTSATSSNRSTATRSCMARRSPIPPMTSGRRRSLLSDPATALCRRRRSASCLASWGMSPRCRRSALA